MHDKINILEQELADIEHLELGLLQVLGDQPALLLSQQPPALSDATPGTGRKQRLIQRIEALKAVQQPGQ